MEMIFTIFKQKKKRKSYYTEIFGKNEKKFISICNFDVLPNYHEFMISG